MITFEEIAAHNKPIAIVGLGYVGLPLVMDIKGFFDPAACRKAGITYWRL